MSVQQHVGGCRRRQRRTGSSAAGTADLPIDLTADTFSSYVGAPLSSSHIDLLQQNYCRSTTQSHPWHSTTSLLGSQAGGVVHAAPLYSRHAPAPLSVGCADASAAQGGLANIDTTFLPGCHAGRVRSRSSFSKQTRQFVSLVGGDANSAEPSTSRAAPRSLPWNPVPDLSGNADGVTHPSPSNSLPTTNSVSLLCGNARGARYHFRSRSRRPPQPVPLLGGQGRLSASHSRQTAQPAYLLGGGELPSASHSRQVTQPVPVPGGRCRHSRPHSRQAAPPTARLDGPADRVGHSPPSYSSQTAQSVSIRGGPTHGTQPSPSHSRQASLPISLLDSQDDGFGLLPPFDSGQQTISLLGGKADKSPPSSAPSANASLGGQAAGGGGGHPSPAHSGQTAQSISLLGGRADVNEPSRIRDMNAVLSGQADGVGATHPSPSHLGQSTQSQSPLDSQTNDVGRSSRSRSKRTIDRARPCRKKVPYRTTPRVALGPDRPIDADCLKKIKKVVDTCQCSQANATHFLRLTNWNLDSAIALVLDRCQDPDTMRHMKALSLVETITDQFAAAKKKHSWFTDLELVARDIMVTWASAFAKTQQEFADSGASTKAHVLFHWTSGAGLRSISENGLLTRRDMNQTKHVKPVSKHGSVFGDGVYLANHPRDFMGPYGDVCLVCVCVLGKHERVFRSANRSTLLSLQQKGVHTIIGNKGQNLGSGRHDEVVLRRSSQCIPIFAIPHERFQLHNGRLDKFLGSVFTQWLCRQVEKTFECHTPRVGEGEYVTSNTTLAKQ